MPVLTFAVLVEGEPYAGISVRGRIEVQAGEAGISDRDTVATAAQLAQRIERLLRSSGATSYDRAPALPAPADAYLSDEG